MTDTHASPGAGISEAAKLEHCWLVGIATQACVPVDHDPLTAHRLSDYRPEEFTSQITVGAEYRVGV